MTAVISCTIEKVVWKVLILGCICSGRNLGIKINEIEIPINSALITEPAAMDTGRESLFPFLFFNKLTENAIIILPIITQGIMAGIADIMGLPLIK